MDKKIKVGLLIGAILAGQGQWAVAGGGDTEEVDAAEAARLEKARARFREVWHAPAAHADAAEQIDAFLRTIPRKDLEKMRKIDEDWDRPGGPGDKLQAALEAIEAQEKIKALSTTGTDQQQESALAARERALEDELDALRKIRKARAQGRAAGEKRSPADSSQESSPATDRRVPEHPAVVEFEV